MNKSFGCIGLYFFSMPHNQRVLRSTLSKTASAVLTPLILPINSSPSSSPNVFRIVAPGATLPGLDSAELSLLRKKQRQLQSNAPATLSSLLSRKHLQTALEASLIFAQYEAGTAVCIDAAGWVLTCAHCFGDTEEEWRAKKRKWLLFYTGLAVQVECRAWDSTRDLALLKIIAIESGASQKTAIAVFNFVSLSSSAPSFKTLIVCVGQPGSDDLESTSDRRTNYNLIEVSEGKFCGMIPGADPDNNSEIGSLKHDAWTYWGHSGAPLLKTVDGTLIGLHSSWDDKTAMRHGVPLIAIKHFLQQQVDAAILPPNLTNATLVDLNSSQKRTMKGIDFDAAPAPLPRKQEKQCTGGNFWAPIFIDESVIIDDKNESDICM